MNEKGTGKSTLLKLLFEEYPDNFGFGISRKKKIIKKKKLIILLSCVYTHIYTQTLIFFK